MRVYLAGPINGYTDAEAKDWRESVKKLLPASVGFLDPMSRDFRGRELEPGIAKEIVEGDKADIVASTHAIFYYEKPSVGTSMELLFAWAHGIPVILIDKSGKPLSPWLTYHATHIVSSIPEAIAKLYE